MPKRSFVVYLPKEIKQELDTRIISGGFAGYRGIASWLRSKGVKANTSGIHRYGQYLGAMVAPLNLEKEKLRKPPSRTLLGKIVSRSDLIEYLAQGWPSQAFGEALLRDFLNRRLLPAADFLPRGKTVEAQWRQESLQKILRITGAQFYLQDIFELGQEIARIREILSPEVSIHALAERNKALLGAISALMSTIFEIISGFESQIKDPCADTGEKKDG